MRLLSRLGGLVVAVAALVGVLAASAGADQVISLSASWTPVSATSGTVTITFSGVPSSGVDDGFIIMNDTGTTGFGNSGQDLHTTCGFNSCSSSDYESVDWLGSGLGGKTSGTFSFTAAVPSTGTWYADILLTSTKSTEACGRQCESNVVHFAAPGTGAGGSTGGGTGSTQADFTFTASPSSLSVIAGSSVQLTLSWLAVGGYTWGGLLQTVGGGPSGMPSGATASSPGGTGSAVWTIITSSTTPAGSYPLMFTVTDGKKTHTASVTLTVSTPAPTTTTSTPTQPPPTQPSTKKLAFGKQLAASGTGYYLYRNNGATWGVLPLIDYLTRAIDRWHAIHPGTEIGVGDLSQKSGLPILGANGQPAHKGHTSGCQVDIRPLRNDLMNSGIDIVKDPTHYDREATAQMIKTFQTTPLPTGYRLLILFNDKRIPGTQYANGHNDHIHFQLISTQGSVCPAPSGG